jgi:hypothetical protein
MKTDVAKNQCPTVLSMENILWVSLSVALYLITPLLVLFALFGGLAG